MLPPLILGSALVWQCGGKVCWKNVPKLAFQKDMWYLESENYCSLDRILVGTHEVNPTMDQCTDCKSFRKR